MSDSNNTGFERYVTEKLDDVSTKVEQISAAQVDQGKTLVQNTAILDEHVRRTNILEAKVDKNVSFIDMVKGSWKVVLLIAFCMGAVATFYEVKEAVQKDNSPKTEQLEKLPQIKPEP